MQQPATEASNKQVGRLLVDICDKKIPLIDHLLPYPKYRPYLLQTSGICHHNRQATSQASRKSQAARSEQSQAARSEQSQARKLSQNSDQIIPVVSIIIHHS